MTNPDLRHIYVVLDRSGSMDSIRTDMEGGFDQFIADQRKQPGQCRVTLHQFDDAFETVYTDKDLADVPPCSLVPRNLTALHDAIGRTINLAGDRLAKLDEAERPSLVTVLVVTDGLENASREFTLDTVREKITHQREQYNWLFIYLGTNQDAVETGAGMGFYRGHTMTYAGGAGGQSAYGSTSNLIGNTARGMRVSGPGGQSVTAYDFTDEDRQAAAEPEKETE